MGSAKDGAPASSPSVAPPALVLCGPSGSGKTTLMKLLTSEFGGEFGFSVSHTTREPRAKEQDGKDYHFTERGAMEALVEQGAFLEHAVFGGNMYGTSRAAVARVASQAKVCILDIDMQGVKQIRQSGLQAKYVFISAPSLAALEARLRERGTETEASLARRMAAAAGELEYGRGDGNFDLVIVNDQVEKAYTQLRSFMLPVIRKMGGAGDASSGAQQGEKVI
jgi:guanylate kinase